MSLKSKEEQKTTNEKPVKIPLPFKEAIVALLATKPETKPTQKQRATRKTKKPGK